MGSAETSDAASRIIDSPLILDLYTDEEIEQAASTLVLMSKQELNRKTANKLRVLVLQTKSKKEIGGNLPRLPLVVSLNGVIEACSEPFEKKLTCSDVSIGQCRLALTREEVIGSILPMLNCSNENIDDGIPVTVYDSTGKDYQMMFGSWGHSTLDVLKTGWTQFCKDHILKAQDWVTVWMFQHVHTRGLCFILTFRRVPGQE